MNQEPSWIRYIKKRIKQNKNFLGIITGPTGSGKSYSALSIAMMLDHKFTTDQCVFSSRELMKLINSGKVNKGSVILWDEAGVGQSHRSWQSQTNKIINYLLQTFRHKNFILIFTSPYLDFIDASTRKLFHAEFKTENIDYSRKVVKLNCQHIQYNSRKSKFYYKRLMFKNERGFWETVDGWNIPQPPNDILEFYEKKKTHFTTELNKEIEEKLNKGVQKLKESKKKGITFYEKEVLRLGWEGKNVKEIGKIMNTQVQNIRGAIQRIADKGFKVQIDFKNGQKVWISDKFLGELGFSSKDR